MAEGCVTDMHDAGAPPQGGAIQNDVTALVAAMREQWDDLDGDERTFLVYCMQQLRHMISRTDETDEGRA